MTIIAIVSQKGGSGKTTLSVNLAAAAEAAGAVALIIDTDPQAGRMLRDVVTNDNTASDVWADTAYRSQSNERWL